MKYLFSLSKISVLLLLVFLVSSGCHPSRKLSKSGENAVIDDLIKKGNKKMVLKDYKGAVADFTKVIEQNPDHADAYLFRAISYYNLQDAETSLKDINKCLEIQPLYAEAYDVRGLLRYDKKDKTGACEDWNKSFDLGFNPAAELIEKYCQ
jgi:tetratricopeptide (TPR) repeat protein